MANLRLFTEYLSSYQILVPNNLKELQSRVPVCECMWPFYPFKIKPSWLGNKIDIQLHVHVYSANKFINGPKYRNKRGYCTRGSCTFTCLWFIKIQQPIVVYPFVLETEIIHCSHLFKEQKGHTYTLASLTVGH